MDCTYKTNRYRFPLLHIVGVTSIERTFSAAFAFIDREKEENYTWVLENLKNRELALVNAITRVFLTTSHLLCRWHIGQNTLCTMKQEFVLYPAAIKYVETNWLELYRQKFVSCWMNNVIHFGNLTSNMVESEHSKLKSYIANCQANFSAAWVKMHDLVKLQITDIKATFEKSLNCWQHQFRISTFDPLRGAASQSAMGLMLPEIKKLDDMVVEDKVDCVCPIRRTHGLPCAQEIAPFKDRGEPIPLSLIDDHWKILSLEKRKDDGAILKIMKANWNIFMGKMAKAKAGVETPDKATIKKSPKAVDDNTPKAKAAVRTLKTANELPQWKKPKLVGTLFVGPYLNNFPEPIRPHIKFITNVKSDGNCGYRAVAYFMRQSEHNWKTCRNDLLLEVNNHYDLYEKVTGIGGANKLRYRLSFFEDETTPENKWMIFPEMGYVVASTYNVVVVLLSQL
ncbi:uncharacterized protein LOC131306846 [Rhododendron vialii]|uniref:uncharacterized protein LOC131306846 n=1 Tax=Rhododendron vialii TaxID=182163 RepID=UPI00265F8920|nr:uncharacterized protein LOC131306846 [Rhododendron vialii]